MAEERPLQGSAAESPQELVTVGLILGPWGIRGDLKVAPMTDFPERFSPGSQLFLDSQPTEVQESRRYKDALIVKLKDVDSRNEADALRGKPLQVPIDQLEPLPSGQYYHFQILDMEVWTKDGRFLGHIEEILSTGSNDVYVVRGDSKKEVLVPALEDVVLEVDVERGRMTVDLPKGLI